MDKDGSEWHNYKVPRFQPRVCLRYSLREENPLRFFTV